MEYDNKGVMEDIGADFDNFLSEKNWVGAQAIIDNLYETGFNQEGLELHKKLVVAKFNI